MLHVPDITQPVTWIHYAACS